MTLQELEDNLPNGFHDAEIFSFELNYVEGIAKFHMNLSTGWPDDPEPERQAYQEAFLVVSGLCFAPLIHLRQRSRSFPTENRSS